ncbi:hypothetical protein PINS_up003351 [Pythium insidiosum]|nr:hypothetical protein PINS_up003351 [Pythium insidiosum]
MEDSIADFAAFLSARVVTRHLETFCGIARELCAHPSTTRQLDDWLQRAPFVIAILPLARETQTSNARQVARLLQRQRAQHPTTRDALLTQWKAVLRVLCDKVITRNVDWLEAIVADFVSGFDNLLDEFVQCHQAISVVPAPRDLQQESREAECVRETDDVDPEVEDEIVDLTTTPHELNEEAGPASEDDDETPLCHPRVDQPTTLVSRIIKRLEVIEATRPWREVFGSNLVCPFPEVKAPLLAKKWRKFWRKHGRAVWERRFWAPFKKSSDEYRSRSNRQRSAQAAYDHIILGVSRVFGPYFFVELDRRAHRHRGWWYRSKAVDLIKVCHVLGEQACWKYLESQCRRRFPRLVVEADVNATEFKTPRPDAISTRSKVVADIAAKVEAIKLAMQAPAPSHERRRDSDVPSPATSSSPTCVIDLSVDDDD